MRYALLAVCVGMLLIPAEASAFKRIRGIPPFPTKNVTWFSASSDHRADVREAARFINASGARVRLVEVRKRKGANIVIRRPGPDSVFGAQPCSGFAQSSSSLGKRLGASQISWRPCLAREQHPVFTEVAVLATHRLLAHELMHALGLDHEERTCTTMNGVQVSTNIDTSPSQCQSLLGGNAAAGLRYCRIVEVDDQNGLIALYGGKRRPLPPRMCERTGLKVPADLAAAVALVPVEGSSFQDPVIRVSWTGLGADVTGMQLGVSKAGCEFAKEQVLRELVRTPSGADTTDLELGPTTGDFCVAVTPFVRLGTQGSTVTGKTALFPLTVA